MCKPEPFFQRLNVMNASNVGIVPICISIDMVSLKFKYFSYLSDETCVTPSYIELKSNYSLRMAAPYAFSSIIIFVVAVCGVGNIEKVHDGLLWDGYAG